MFMSVIRSTLLLLFALWYSACALAQFSVVPTYHSIGVYWKPAGVTITDQRARVTYWKDGQSPEEGLELWFDNRTGPPTGTSGTFPEANKRQFRGSLVHLDPGTVYNVKVQLYAANGTTPIAPEVAAQTTTETWTDTDQLQVAADHVITLPSQTIKRMIVQRSTSITVPSASLNSTTMEFTVTVPDPAVPDPNKPWKGPYVKIQPSGAVAADIDRGGMNAVGSAYDGMQGESCVEVRQGVKRVILHGLKMANCTRNGVVFWYTNPLQGVTSDVVIEDAVVTNFGWAGLAAPDLPDGDAGVQCAFNSAASNVKPTRIVLQRNQFIDPRYTATHWDSQAAHHPVGPQGVLFTQCGNNHVFRYNEILGTVAGKPVTFTANSPNISWPGHGQAPGTPVVFSNSGGALPSPLTAGTQYFVVGTPQADSFQVSATRGGTAITPSSAGSGTHTAARKRFFMDGIGGNENFSYDEGWISGDTDIYQNVVTHVYDDGIEAEGSNRNVRIWGNYFDRTFMPIGNASIGLGPVYVWRNVSHSAAGYMHMIADGPYNSYVYTPRPDTENPRMFVKAGGNTNAPRGGRGYYMHNTILQPASAYCSGSLNSCGSRMVISDDGSRELTNVYSFNNIWHTATRNSDGAPKHSQGTESDCATSGTCKFEGDLHNATLPQAGIPGKPTYEASGGNYPGSGALPSVSNDWTGNFQLAASSLGKGVAIALNQFNNGSGSDVGAHQSGTVMKFGRAASPNGGTVNAALNTTPSPASGPAPLQITFNASASTSSGSPIASLRLQFGHNAQEITWSDKNVTQSYTYPPGNFTAILRVTAENGQFDEATVPVAASCGASTPSAVLQANPQSGSAPLQVSFDASQSSAVAPATITAYSIDYGDGASGTGVTQSHTYNNAGQRTARLIVTDSNGCQSAPSDKIITVQGSGSGSATLQQGLNSYTGVTDAWLWGGSPDTNRDLGISIRTEGTGACAFCDSAVLRFAIFQSEGGPVPDGATITSATLSLYQFAGPAATFKVSRLLKSWHEQQVTYNVATTGAPWSSPGANGSGTDYVATPDAQATGVDANATACTTPNETCWVNFDVTTGVQAFAAGATNNGWKLAQVSSPVPGNYKNFNHSEQVGWEIYRPKLVVTWTTTPPGTTATLRQGLNSYAGTTDAHLWGGQPDTNRDLVFSIRTEGTGACAFCDSAVVRFAIFQSEGGPVPNGSTISSATLSLYQFAGPSATFKLSRLLKNWNEQEVTYNVAASGTPWTSPGANGSGTDYLATPDAQATSVDANAVPCTTPNEVCWVHFDVTSGVQAFAGGTANFGWKIAQVSSPVPGNYKNFNNSESSSNTSYRPTLTIIYTAP